MTEKRLCTREELDAMGARTLDLLTEAVDLGDKKTAINLGKRMYAEFQAMHDLYRDWLTHMFSIVGRKYGDQALADALEETVSRYTRRLAPRYQGKSARRRLEILVAGLRGHLEPMEIEEDDEKFTVNAVLCGSGGRQVRQGLYEEPDDLLKVKGPHEWTFDRTDFPVYCAHCYFQNQIPLEPGKAALFKTEPAEKIGEQPCKFHVYKEENG